MPALRHSGSGEVSHCIAVDESTCSSRNGSRPLIFVQEDAEDGGQRRQAGPEEGPGAGVALHCSVARAVSQPSAAAAATSSADSRVSEGN